MMTNRIAVCGAPLAGKRTFLEALARETNVPARMVSESSRVSLARQVLTVQELDSISNLFIPYNDREINLYTASGALWRPHKIYNYLLSQADAVVYVFSNLIFDLDESAQQEAQEKIFAKHVELAKKHGKLWTQIPWIVVVNKADVGPEIKGTDFSLPSQLPDYLKTRSIRTIAYKGVGDDLVWQRILEAVQGESQHPA